MGAGHAHRRCFDEAGRIRGGRLGAAALTTLAALAAAARVAQLAAAPTRAARVRVTAELQSDERKLKAKRRSA